ncbi:hypothetical protein BC827DRAFT_1271936 [Russula dissimulans]|nr:hypothetical protein BC827DRAFT_1271936 [Russula dissimulans]
MSHRDAIVAFIPRISQPGGKRKRDGRPAPGPRTVEELIQQHGKKRVKITGSGQFIFRGGLYQEGLVFEIMPWSLLRISEHFGHDITPFARLAKIRNYPTFATGLKWFAQDSICVGNRVLVVIADVVTQTPEEDSGLTIGVTLRHLIPHFLTGDHVKDHWSDCFGMVVAVDQDTQEVTFLDKNSNAEINVSAYSLQFHSPTLRYFKFTPGLHVEFSGKGGVTRRGIIVQASGGRVQVMDERSVQHVDVKLDDITVSGVQAAALPKPECKCGYRGLIKAKDHYGVDVELDAMLVSHGPIRQWVNLQDIQLEFDRGIAAGPSHHMPPPIDLPQVVSPEPEDHEESTDSPWCFRPGHAPRHWLFAEEIQECLREGCIPFHVRGVPASSLHAKMEGLTAKTVPIARRKIEAQLNEVIVSVFQRGRPTQISLDPKYLVPWLPSKDNKVLIIRHHQVRQVGKLVKLEDQGCLIKLDASGANASFDELDVINLLQK